MKVKELFKVFYIFLFWLALSSLIIFLAPKILPYKASFPYSTELKYYGMPFALEKLANFDGVHYLTIAKNGYLGTDLIQAFFPFYPFLISLINPIFHNYLLSGIVISHIFALISFYLLYYLVKNEFNQKIALNTVIIFAFFVSSFYLRSLYNESLFLTLILASFITAKKKHYLLAGVLGGLASATRVVGIFILPSLFLMIYLKDKRNWQAYLKVSISALGLLAYMFYLRWQFNDYLYFFHVQSEFGASRQTQLVLLPQVIYRYLKIFMTVRPIDFKYFAYVQEFLLSIFALILLSIASYSSWKNKKIVLPYLLFALMAYFLPTLTGNFSSMPRYLLACFPLFAYLAIKLENKKQITKFIYLTISLIFFIINLILFSQGYWVA